MQRFYRPKKPYSGLWVLGIFIILSPLIDDCMMPLVYGNSQR
ncbi:hypothetical protein HMPREF0476_0070 [Kingella kingae ATCC 23330]|uniref:Uncharacterized protein n=1 Tax=Kingella kingae ATCC 23330 TaxID=887327 RepID=F5S4D7_KINKI|nr:hypothetical protein HMPREF0476_0070 [Kingella kingae ATCC 23330]